MKPTFVGDIVTSCHRGTHEHVLSIIDNKQEEIDFTLEQNKKYIGTKITEITFKKERGQENKTIVWLIDYGKNGRVQVISKLSDEELQTLFKIINVKFPPLGTNPENEPEMVPYESIIADGHAISEAHLTAYNLQEFTKKLIFYTKYKSDV